MESNAVKRLYRIEGFMGIFAVFYFLMLVMMFLRLFLGAKTLVNHSVLVMAGVIALIGGGILLGWAILIMIYKKDYSRYRRLRKNEEMLKHFDNELRRLEKRVKILTNDRIDLMREIEFLKDDSC